MEDFLDGLASLFFEYLHLKGPETEVLDLMVDDRRLLTILLSLELRDLLVFPGGDWLHNDLH